MSRRFLRAAFAPVLACFAAITVHAGLRAPHQLRTLTTEFTYRATVPALPNDAKHLRLWVPLPSDSPWQTVRDLTIEAPGPYRITREKNNGNRMVYVEAAKPSGPVVATVRFTVNRCEPRIEADPPGPVSGTPGAPLRRFLQPERMVPVGGRYAAIARSVTGGRGTPFDAMRSVFDHVIATMQYDYGKESPHYAEGDVAFVCDYRKGNCTDLHSYIVSMARSLGIPAYIEFGFPVSGVPIADPLPKEGSIGGYHCWTWFHDPVRGWVPLDAADGRRWVDAGHPEVKGQLFGGLIVERSAVAFSRGRDITLSPPQRGAPLNYFIYPYAEADGAPVKADWEVRYRLRYSSH